MIFLNNLQIVLAIFYAYSAFKFVRTNKCNQNEHLGKVSGQFNLLGLVPTVTKTRGFGLIVLETIKFAVGEVNRDIFYNKNILGYELRDTCSNHGLAFITKVTVDVLLGDDSDEQDLLFNSCRCREQTFKYLGFVGPSYSSHAIYVNQILSGSNIPSISFSATSIELRNYPDFFRTIAADDVFAKAVLDFLEHFNWSYVSIVASSDSYGFYGKQTLVDLFNTHQICVDIEELFTIPYESSDLSRIINKLKHSQTENASARVVVVFAIEFAAYDILKMAEQLQFYNVTWILSDASDLSHWFNDFHPNIITGLFTYVHVGGKYMEFYEYMVDIFHHPDKNVMVSTFLNENNITTLENYTNVLSSGFYYAGFIRNAVFAYGNALQDYLTSVCLYQSFVSCSANFNLTLFLNTYLRNVSFPGLRNESISFNKYGDVNIAFLNLQNVQYKHQELGLRTIGMWDSNNGLSITDDISWATGSSNAPLSRCSETCKPGHFPVLNIGKKCCWTCVKCQEGHMKSTYGNDLCTLCQDKVTNANRTKCIEFKWSRVPDIHKYIVGSCSGFGVLCSIFVIMSLMKFRYTPVVKACSFQLSIMQVVAQLFLFIAISIIIVDGNTTMCIVFIFIDGWLCTFIISIMLVKSELILRAFTCKVKTNAQDIRKTKAIGAAILLCTSLFEFLIIGTLLLFTNADEKITYYVQDLTKERSCRIDLHIKIQLFYIVVLALACGVEAFRCRNVPSKYNEAHVIVYTIVAVLLLFTLYIPLHISASNGIVKSFRLYILCYCTNMAILFIMFGYKLWIAWFKPHCNVSQVFQMSIFAMVMENVQKQLDSKRIKDPSDRVHAAVKDSQVSGVQEGQEDYQKLTPKEENDLNSILSQFEDALTNVEVFTDQLSTELQELEYVNITSLMGSEQQAKDLLSLIDKSAEELNQLDDRLTYYDGCLQKVSDQMGQMEFKDNRMEIERINNKQLLEEIKYIVGKLDISQRHVRSLREGDLYNPLGIEECISAGKILLEAFHTPFNHGITELRAVQDQLSNIMTLKSEFAQRFFYHLDKFISQHSNVELISYKPNNDLSIQSHDSVHDDFSPYIELMKWLKDLDNSKYTEIRTHYEESFTVTYDKEFKEYLEAAKLKASMKVKASRENMGPAKSKSSLHRLRPKDSKLKRSPSKESIDSMTSIESSNIGGGSNTLTHFDQVFDVVLSELEPYVSAEQDFCSLFFHLRYPGDNYEESARTLPDELDGAMLSRVKIVKQQHDVTVRDNLDEVRDMMKNMFGFIDMEIQNFITFGESLHPHNILYAMNRIQNQASHLVTSQTTGSPPTFLGSLFGGWLVCTKRMFDKYIDSMCHQIKELRIQKKKRNGILADVLSVEKFFKASENIFRGSERRGDIDKAYQRLINRLVTKIEEVAEENDKPPPEIVMFENYHYLHGVIRGLKNSSLENEKKEAEQNYHNAMHQYIATRLGRPLDKMSRFFQGVESCINSGVRMEDIGYQIALNQQELKNVIKEYPHKEVKKGLDVLYRKIEKYVSEAGLTQVLWHNLQEAFVRQYERYQELVTLCYPNSNIKLPVTIDEILEFFSKIAQSH